MSFEVKINNRLAKVNLLKWEESFVTIVVDGKEYSIDFDKVGNGIFSILHKNRSLNIELVPGENVKKYTINTGKSTFEVEIVDAETKYRDTRQKGIGDDPENTIISPIPGKVVKIAVNVGDKVEAGQTLIIFSAMKMESEFKSKNDGIVKDILVKEGEVVEGNKVMVMVE